jgi:nucleoid-associated protein YgaU
MRVPARRRVCFQGGVLVSLMLSCAAAGMAQDLGAIARQERERKKEQPPRATYVYTNDDLQRQHILVPEDQARVVAARRSDSTPAPQVAQNPAPAPLVAASSGPAPASVPTVPVSLPPAAGSSLQPSANVEAVVTPRSPAAILERVRRLVREESARDRAQKQWDARSAVSSARSETLLPPVPEKEAVHRASAPNVASRSVLPARQPRRVVPAREPDNWGIADVITVEQGDSLWTLARRYLGKGSRWRELAASNPQILNPHVIYAGEWICLPQESLQTARRRVTPRARAPASVGLARAPAPSPSPPFAVQIASHRRFTEP